MLLQETTKGIHILGITETHLSSLINYREIQIVRNDRSKGAGGSVCAYIRNDLSWHRRPDLENDKIEAIWTEISISKSKPISICFVYRPPDTSKYLIKDFDDVFSNMMSTSRIENKEIILAGDLNCDYRKPSKTKL